MARLTIPESLKPALARLVSMEDRLFEHLLDLLRNVQPASNPEMLASRIEPKLQDLPEGELSNILAAVLSLYNVRALNETATPNLIEDLGHAIASAKLTAPLDSEAFRRRFETLLDIPSLSVSAKAFAIQREQPRIFMSGRVFSDIRPVFPEEPEHPRAALILHQLKISYFEDDERKEFFVTLDSDDLSSLQKVFTRAQAKTKALATLIERADLANLG